MNEERHYTKLKDLVNDSFRVEAVEGFKFKMWDPATKRMLVAADWERGYRKLYQVQTDKGWLDLGSGQLGNLLEAVFMNGSASLIGRRFNVKSNGKEGTDIRYFFNPLKEEPAPVVDDMGDYYHEV